MRGEELSVRLLAENLAEYFGSRLPLKMETSGPQKVEDEEDSKALTNCSVGEVRNISVVFLCFRVLSLLKSLSPPPFVSVCGGPQGLA